jgi:hypothetical protein
MQADPDATLYHLTATLTEPETLERRPAEFDSAIVAAIEERRPEHARGWSIELPSPTRCVLHADIEAMTEQGAAFELLTALERALFPLPIRPRAIDVRVETIRVEVSYLP